MDSANETVSERSAETGPDAAAIPTLRDSAFSARRGIGLLVVIHVALGLLFGWLGMPGGSWTPERVMFWGVVFADTGLLAIVAATIGTNRRWIEANFVALIYAWALLRIFYHNADRSAVLLINSAMYVIVYLATKGTCCLGAPLERLTAAIKAEKSVRFQFTIRQLLGITALVSMLLMFVMQDTSWLQEPDDIFTLAVLSICLSLSPLIALWASIYPQNGSRLPRFCLALVVALIPGSLPVLLLRHDNDWDLIAVTLVQGFLTLATLLAVRLWCERRTALRHVPANVSPLKLF